MDESEIHRQLKRLSRVRPNLFGADGHAFVLHAPLSQAFIAEFEAQHHIPLPADYRWFVTTIANGGAGPGYGVFRFGESDNGPWQEGDGFVGVLARPFPFTAPWNDLAGMPPVELMESDEPRYVKELAEFEKCYFTPVDGAIPICHMGCAIRIWLIVSGAEAGHLWRDDRASDGGWEPLAQPPASRLGFLQWYQEWLSAANRGEDLAVW